jgi:two-component system response regulator FixJ
VEAMRNGAIDFLQKPFREQQLLDSVQKALALERRSRETRGKNEMVAARLACLTAREQEVLKKVLQGLRTKEIAAELHIATKTAEEYRANVMHKMHASTIAELISVCATQSDISS